MKIAFCGPMRAGKDTAADALGWTRLKFADPLYQILAEAQRITGLPPEKDRKFLQFVGTEWGRHLQGGLWTRAMLHKLAKTAGPVVITDARFYDEFEALREEGFVLVLIDRDRWARWESEHGRRPRWWEKVLDYFKTPHASERDWRDFNFDYTLKNDGTIRQLHDKVRALAFHEGNV